MPIPTPFYSRTSALCESQAWGSWSGYLAAATYELSHEREYFAIRDSAALIDVSPLFKYEISGPDAESVVNKIITRDIRRCDVGQIFYTPWCNEEGDIIDDGTVWRLNGRRFRITAADPNLRWFQDCAYGSEAEIEDVSTDLAALALQGPKSRAVLQRLLPGVGLDTLGYYRFLETQLDGRPLTISRTGYTGDLGYELWIAPQHAEFLWDAVVEGGRRYGLLPAGIAALDIARIEAGLLLIEVDYVSSRKALTENRKSSPYEAGLGWTVSQDKGPFIGRSALRSEQRRGPAWAFVGLDINWGDLDRLFAAYDLPPLVAGRASRDSAPVYSDGGRQVGQITSSAFSPLLKKYLALATVEPRYARPGTELLVEVTIEFTRQRARATVSRRPFYDPPRKRS